MTSPRGGANAATRRWSALADSVLLPCFDGIAAPDWIRRRVAGGLGGVCLFARNVADEEQLAALSASLAAENPEVVVAIDEEAGDVTRIDARTGSRFPGAAALGRVDDPALTEAIGREVGTLLAAVGVSANFAPCADVRTDATSSVIGARSFGGCPDLVARHVAAWTVGQQSAGVAACAKHFPGHGGAAADSHLGEARLPGGLAELARTGLPPFRAAIAAGAAAVMIGHLRAPDVDDLPATVSRRWLGDVLRGKLGFTGTVVTDALEMRALAGRFGLGGGAVRALAAGADLLCVGGTTLPEEGIDQVAGAIVDAVRSGALSERRLADAAQRARRIGVAAARRLADRAPLNSAPFDAATVRAGDIAADVSGEVARRALAVAGPLPPPADPVLIVRCVDVPTIAAGDIPFGPGAVLDRPHTEIVLHSGDPLPVVDIGAAATVLVVTREYRRRQWMREILDRIRARHPRTVLVEMGADGIDPGDGPAIASFGASAANARAVVAALFRPSPPGAARRPG